MVTNIFHRLADDWPMRWIGFKISKKENEEAAWAKKQAGLATGLFKKKNKKTIQN